MGTRDLLGPKNINEPVLIKFDDGLWYNVGARVFEIYDEGKMVAVVTNDNGHSVVLRVKRECVKLLF